MVEGRASTFCFFRFFPPASGPRGKTRGWSASADHDERGSGSGSNKTGQAPAFRDGLRAVPVRPVVTPDLFRGPDRQVPLSPGFPRNGVRSDKRGTEMVVPMGTEPVPKLNRTAMDSLRGPEPPGRSGALRPVSRRKAAGGGGAGDSLASPLPRAGGAGGGWGGSAPTAATRSGRKMPLRLVCRKRPSGRCGAGGAISPPAPRPAAAVGPRTRRATAAPPRPGYLKTASGSSRLSEPSNAIFSSPSEATTFSIERVCAVSASIAAWTRALPSLLPSPIIWS